MRLVNHKQHQRMFFIGVSTRQSSIMKVFPLWMQELGRPEISLEGMDLKLNDHPLNYRQVVNQIKEDPLCLGALVTTHKINLLKSAYDLFDYIDPLAQISGEVSCLSKRNGLLRGHAKDPISGGLSMDALLGPDFFACTGGQVLFLGAGGSTTALALYLSSQAKSENRPQRMILVDRIPARLEELRGMIESKQLNLEVEYHCHEDPRRNDELVRGLPPGSAVINATGMGKDLPGSPITDECLFPMTGVAWELNYRGELRFLRQAIAQRQRRKLKVEDGWVYFLHGWTQVIAEVLDVGLQQATFSRLAEIAEIIRPVGRAGATLKAAKGNSTGMDSGQPGAL